MNQLQDRIRDVIASEDVGLTERGVHIEASNLAGPAGSPTVLLIGGLDGDDGVMRLVMEGVPPRRMGGAPSDDDADGHSTMPGGSDAGARLRDLEVDLGGAALPGAVGAGC